MKTCVIFHEVDLDGQMSAAIVKHWFNSINDYPDNVGKGNIDFIGYNYGQPIPDLSEYDKVIMCDISFPKEEMYSLYKSDFYNFVWIDHHISAINNWKEELDKNEPNHGWELTMGISGIRDTKFAACELTWKYFFPNESIPEIVRLLGLYDSFRHKQVWKSVVGYEGLYEVSNHGNVRSLDRTIIENNTGKERPIKGINLSIANSKRGYRVVVLCKDGTEKMRNVHQLVAESFISNPENKPCINHKDFNRLNNHVNNLEWCTYAENNLHSIEEGKKGRTVIQFTKDGEFVQQFDSIKRAESHTGIASQNIGKVCKGEREFAGEYKWEYGVDKDVFPQFVPEDEEQKVLEFQYGARQCISNYEEAYNYLIQCTRAKESEYWRLQAQVVVDSILEQGKAIYQYLCTEAKQSYKNGFEINFSPIKDKVFLGGTCNNSSWRSELIPMLCINYFNPVVEDWTPDCQQEEYRQKEQECNIHLYVITKEMTGVFSIAEVIDSVHSNKETIFVVNPDGFDNRQLKSLQAVLDMVLTHGGKGKITNNINDIALLINRLESDTFTKSSKFICINKERFNPINFGIDYHKDGYDGCACFHYDGQRKLWIFSLYNANGEVDCSVIAKQYGGGGHRGASGFVTKDLKGIIE